MTYYILFFIQVRSRRVHLAGLTPNLNGGWMTQMARNATMREWSFLTPGQHVIHDRDTKYCSTFQETIKTAGVTPPYPSSTLSEFECPRRALDKVREGRSPVTAYLIWGRLQQGLNEYVTHYHQERNYQGSGNELLLPRARKDGWGTNLIRARKRRSGLLTFYSRKAA